VGGSSLSRETTDAFHEDRDVEVMHAPMTCSVRLSSILPLSPPPCDTSFALMAKKWGTERPGGHLSEALAGSRVLAEGAAVRAE
jgi:hypothetical protein